MGGCCVGNCGFCCVGDCGFCCIGDFFSCNKCGDCCVGEHSSSDSVSPKEDPVAKHAADIATELAEMRKRATEDAKKDEADCLKDIDENIQYFIKLLEEVNSKKYGGRSLNINIDRIKEINGKLRDEVVGFVGRKFDNRLVATDREVAVILEERDNAKRKKNFEAFYQRIRKEALRELIEKIETAVREQSDSIEREIQNRINELNNNMAQETRAFEEIKRFKDKESSRLAEVQVDCMYYADLCDIMFDELKTSSLNIGR